ncbi:phosphate ABC transporter substrate-binding protein, PhoT family [Pyrobaculum islandicum DSM 4184]|uniref:Phosphate-binding protein n=1 Tax=Pyrobaculum islandicum (strain DSM 4184 / JCM 9189 / GEO3) TaxID=384616 RepID=A1RR58_PYRIL|nr:phosphate ABC transporter substrate-binding protein PstS [Pyrobaculum islandicum]ABL87440.1 phosphate ABC transporter substrate-binding protein, PhoT family [Pyrobaculum islandicum DSM 4184]
MERKILYIGAVVALAIVVAVVGLYLGQQTTQPTTPTPAQQTQTTPQPAQTTAQTPQSSPPQTSTQQPQASLPGCGEVSGQIVAGGATFPGPQYDAWIKQFSEITGGRVKITYNYLGSGAGQAGLIKGELAFAGSDLPLAPARFQEQRGKILQFPVVMGGILVVYNVPEVAYEKTGKRLNLTAEIIGDIYMGKIRYWDDPKIKAVNPALADRLPRQPITPVHRSDASGTTGWFTLFLTKAYPLWNQTVGWGLSVNWPVAQMGVSRAGQGNPGVAQLVLNTPYSIGYVEYNYWVTQRQKFDAVGGYALVQNGNDGKFYDPTPEAIAEAASEGLRQVAAKMGGFPSASDDWWQVVQLFAYPPRGYPIVGLSFAMIRTDYSGYPDPNTAAVVKCFFRYVLTEGQKHLVEGYLPLPPELAQVGLKAVG